MATADRTFDVEDLEPVSVWHQLRDAADIVLYRPKLRDGLVWQQLKTVHGEDYWIIQNPQAATYLRLAMEDFYVFQLMDGTLTVQELVVAYMLKFRKFALQRVARLVQDLRHNEFLVDRPYFTFRELRQKARRRTPASLLNDYLKLFLNREFPISGIDGMLERAYRAGVWVLFSRPMLILYLLIALAGVPLFVRYLVINHFSLFPGGSFAQNLLGYYVSLVIIAITHELSHAFMVKARGRVVRRGGGSIFYGFPGLFVDTQDIWMEPRGPRMAVSWAGPYSGLIYAGLVGLFLTFVPDSEWSTPVRLFGTVALVVNLFQLMPLIQLDGYFILMDWLEMPMLRMRALQFVRHDLWAKIRRRQRFNREERIFAIFGLLAATYSAYAIFVAAAFWWQQASDVIQGALRVPSLGSLIGLIVTVLLVVPLVLALCLRLLGLVRMLIRTAQRASGVARERWLRERAAVISQVPALADLGREQTQALAGRLREEWFSPGQALVREGDRGDRFYLIATGRADVVHEVGGDREEVLATLGPMDYFGERALLADVPRAATVRAKTSLRVFSVGAAEFRKSLAPYIGADASLRARLQERSELDQFALFDPLSEREKDVLLSRLRTETYGLGDVVVQQGVVGTDFYCIRSGRVAVTRRSPDGVMHQVATLGPGEFFGEVALLLKTPRNATVTALEETQAWVLAQPDFEGLLRRYFDLSSALSDTVRARLPAAQVLLDLAPPTPASSAEPGEAAPDFRLESLDGQLHELAEFRGSPLLLWFSPGLTHRDSREHAVRLDLLVAAGAVLVQIIPEAPPAARELQTAEVQHLVLCDPSKLVYLQYGLYVPEENTPPPHASAWWEDLQFLARREHSSISSIGVIREAVIAVDAQGRIGERYVVGPRRSRPTSAAIRQLEQAAIV